MFDVVVGKNVCGIFIVVVGGVVGAVSDFGGGIGVWGWIRGCHLLTRLMCVYVCVGERERERLFAGRMMREVQGSQAVSSIVSVASE